MSDKFRYFTIDTNFFIAGFGENPNDYELLHKIFRKLKIKILITNYVQKELRWYMRRIIEPNLIVKEISDQKLKKYEADIASKVKMKLPQTPDVSVAFLAKNENIPLVSSDLRLVELAQKLGIEAMMNSAFLIMLQNEIESEHDQKFIQMIYNKIFSEEITYSVKSQGRYDPVIRIQKIMDSALNVVKQQNLGTTEKSNNAEIKKEYDFPEYHELSDVTKAVRTDISDFISIIEEGNYKRANFVLREARIKLLDLSTEVRMLGVTEEDLIYKEALTTLAHVLLLSSSVAIGEQRLNDADGIIGELMIILLENVEVEKRLDMEVHLQRMTVFFLTEQFERFKLYYTPAFENLCKERKREDILQLFRTIAIIIATLSSNEAIPTATARDFSEIQYIIQLGVQFIAVNKVENAWLLLEQAVYMSMNSKMTGLLYAVLEVLLPLSFKSGYKFRPSFEDLVKIIRENEKNLPFDDYLRRRKRNKTVEEKLLMQETASIKNAPNIYSGFFDVISAELVDFKNVGKAVFVRTVDWTNMHFIGIVDPSLSLDETLTVGSSVKIHEGKIQIIEPTKKIKKNREVDILILCKPDNLKFILRRAGQVTVAQSKVGEYDL